MRTDATINRTTDRMMRRVIHTVLLTLFLCAGVQAQSGSSITDGTTPLGLTPGAPAGSYALSGFENVNPFNGGLNFTLPLLQVGGRGGVQHTIPLRLETKWRVMRAGQTPGPFIYYPNPNDWEGIAPGYSPGAMNARLTGINDVDSCPTDGLPSLTRLTFTAADGTEYEFRDVLHDGEPGINTYEGDVNTCTNLLTTNRGRVFVTFDGSAMTFISDRDILDYDSRSITQLTNLSGYMFTKDGTRYRIDNCLVSWIEDRNGNRMTFEYGAYGVNKITDSLNRVVTIKYLSDDPDPNDPSWLGTNQYDEIRFKGFGGASRSIKIHRDRFAQCLRTTQPSDPTVPWSYHDLFPDIQWASPDDKYNPRNFVSSVELPDGRSYTFYYDVYGELARVGLPTGGAIEYDWDCGLNGGNIGGSILGGQQIYRRVIERRVYADGSTLEGKTQFSKPEDAASGPPSSVTVIVTQRDANDNWLAKSFHYYTGSAYSSFNGPTAIPTGYSPWQDGKEYRTETQESNGTTTQRSESDWAQRAPVSWWTGATDLSPANDPRITESRATWVATGQTAKQQFLYDQYNNQTEVKEFDFGAATFTRRTVTTYVTSNAGFSYDAVLPNTTSPDANATIHLRGLPLQQSVYDAGGNEKARTTYEYDNYTQGLTARAAITGHASLSTAPYFPPLGFTTSYLPRGNPTQVTKWLLPATPLSTRMQYDIAGNAVSVTDPKGNTTAFDFGDRFGAPDSEAESNTLPPGGELNGGLQTFAFATKVTNPAPFNHTAYTQFDYYLGKPVNGEDANQVVASATYGSWGDGTHPDKLDRAAELEVAVNFATTSGLRRLTRFTYDDSLSARTITTQSDQSTYNDHALQSTVVYDGLGRTIEARQYETPTAYISTTTSFDGLGRAYRVSNPFRPGDTVYYTTTAYDGLSRVKTVTTPDNGVMTTSYNGNQTTVVDQANKQRRSFTDGLGRLIQVDEMLESPSTAVYATTTYNYDVLDDLIQVNQGSQTRRFAYDSLKRLIYAANPEQASSGSLSYNGQNWAVAYSYDNNANLLTKTDSRLNQSSQLVQVSYAYDNLNRVTTRSYNDGTPAVTYSYDAAGVNYSKGRLTSVTNSVSTTDYVQYDALGRVLQSRQTTNVAGGNNIYSLSYAYNLAGAMTTETYPSGRVINTAYDTAGRVSQLAGQQTGEADKTYVSSLTYTAHGAVSQLTLGNNLIEKTAFNSRLQPTKIQLGDSSNPASRLQLDYTYGVRTNGVLDATKNNGNLESQHILVGALDVTQSYSYDQVNRLLTAEEKTTTPQVQQWKQAFSYDRFGNRNFDTGNTTANVLGANPTFDANTTTNRFAARQGYGYDAAGNVTAEPGGKSYIYDAESHQTSFMQGGTTSYGYDGDGRRVTKTNADNSAVVYVYDTAGRMIAEYQTSAPAGGGTSYLTQDHLGSTRVVTKADGSIRARYDYLPFGEEVAASIGGRSGAGYVSDNTRQKFTGHERDQESGLDFAQARYCSSATGRFMSPDSVIGEIGNPQSLNLYAYVMNNPIRFVDPTGHFAQQNKEKKPDDQTGTVLITPEQWFEVFKFLFGDFIEPAGDAGTANGLVQGSRGLLANLINPGTANAANEVAIGDTNLVSSILRGASPLELGVPASTRLVITPTIREELVTTPRPKEARLLCR